MKNLYLIGFLLLLFNIRNLPAQNTSSYAGALSHEKYFENPSAYLAGLDSSKINSDVLIDRSFVSDKTLAINGLSQVTTLDYGSFYQVYQELKYAHNNIQVFPEFDTLLNMSRLLYAEQQINPVLILDFNFKKIKPEALANGEFIQTEAGLTDQNATINSYSSHRALTFSCLKHNIFGEQVKFLPQEAFHLDNQTHLVLQFAEMDFGNGQGFQPLTFGQIITVNYTGSSNYVELKLKLTYLNQLTNQNEVVYAHSSVYRQSSEGIPPVIKLDNYTQSPPPASTSRSSEPQPADDRFNFSKYNLLDVVILFNPDNHSEKLRRPLIMVDGFDANNTRDYYKTTHDDPKILPKDNDLRGLYAFLDGQRSPWDLISDHPDTEDSHMVEALQTDGYDLVFVNFREGAGDVNENAKRLRDLLNQCLNGPKYRDNKTEEAILVGPSMGGLITRIALTEMEAAGEEHYVKTWLSLDSPHKGANIPLGIQHTMLNMTQSSLWLIRDKAYPKLDVLAKPASLQLLKFHHTATNNKDAKPHPQHLSLQNRLNLLGFPRMSRNYAITNGGTELLYPDGDEQIGLFKNVQFGITLVDMQIYKLRNGFHPLTHTKVRGYEKFDNIGGEGALNIENCPGGWNSALYSLNKMFNDNIYFDIVKKTPKRYDYSTFIPTSSAFGMELTASSIQKTWQSYTNCNDFTSGKIRTPFDGVYGMTGENQEHVKISILTKDHVIKKWFETDFDNANHPVIRPANSNPIHQTVSKPVSYVARQTVTFGGNNNSIVFNSKSDVNILAGSSVKLLPGTSIKSGALVKIKIQVVNYNTTAKKAQKPTTVAKNPNSSFSKGSLYEDKVFDYSSRNSVLEIAPTLNISVYPNPAKDMVNIGVSGLNPNSLTQITIVNAAGQTVYQNGIQQNGTYVLNSSTFAPGIYLVKISNTQVVHQSKIIIL